MLHYKGLIHPEPWITIKLLKDSEMNTTETLGFYDDELCENSCNKIREELQEHYGGDALIHVYYEKDKNHAIIEITKYFNKKDDIPQLVSKFKSSFEEYYNKTFYEYRV